MNRTSQNAALPYREHGCRQIAGTNAVHLYTGTYIEYHTQLAKMSFDEIFDLTAGVYFYN